MIRGIAIGTFDLFHEGHVNFLRECKNRCGHLTVALNTDEFAARYKRPPVIPLGGRFACVRACRYVNDVLTNTGDEDSRKVINYCGADVVFHGDDWQGEDFLRQLGVTQEWLDLVKVRIEYVPYFPATSTSEIIERIRGERTCGFCEECGIALMIGNNPDRPTPVSSCGREACDEMYGRHV